MAFDASSNIAAARQTLQGESSSLDLAKEGPMADAAIQKNASAPPQEQARNDRLLTVTTTQDSTADVLVHAISSQAHSRVGKNSLARISRRHGPLPTMPSLPTSSQFRLACVEVGGPSHHHHCSRLIASSTMTARGVPINVGVGVKRYVEETKVRTEIPFRRLGLPPPPRLANIFQVPSTIQGTTTPAKDITTTGKKRKESWESNCENSTSFVRDPTSTVCLARSYFTSSSKNDESSTSKRVRRSTRSSTKNAALVVEVRSEQQETRRVIEAAMALSSIGLRDGRSLVPAVTMDH